MSPSAYGWPSKWPVSWQRCGHASVTLWLALAWMALAISAPPLTAQESRTSAQRGTERSKPLWQLDPRVAAGSADASLRAIAAPSADRVWAVGDRGLIIASQDGGRSWVQQSSGTSLNLYGLAFLNDSVGFAVGGSVQPLSQTSLGIVLTTEDAGAHWQTIASGSLPRLTGIVVEEQGILRAWGDYSPLLSGGIFESFDRGRSWQSLPSPLVHINATARQVGGLRLAVDRAGRLSRVPSHSPESLQQLTTPAAPITALWQTGNWWLAVGHQGTCASSRDGHAWQDVALPLSASARLACDFRCIAQVNQHIWIAGSPGSLLLHSSDGGQTWVTHATDQTWPINTIHFFDQYRGWAVTDAGSVLATRDGGKTWFTQRAPLQRLGLHAFAALPTQISWPALAEASWRAQQGTRLTVLHRENLEEDVDFRPDSPGAISALGAQVGLVAADQLHQHPLPDIRIRTIAKSASQTKAPAYYAATTRDQLLEEMVLQLRIGRPSVVLVDDIPNGDRPSSILAETAVRALPLAASNTVDNAWMQHELHLKPWQASKLVGSNSTHKADFTISVDALLRDSGVAIEDAIAPVFGLGTSNGPNASLHCLQLNQLNKAARTTLFHATERHADATRAVDLSNVGNFQLVMGRTHLQKAWQSLQPTASNVTEPHQTWLDNKLNFIIDASPKHEVGPALVSLAKSHFQAAQWQRWIAILERGANYAPQSDAARWCALQQLQFAASDERLAWQQMIRSASDNDSTDSTAPAIAGRSSQDAWNSTPFELELSKAKKTSDDLSARPGPGTRRGEVVISGGSSSPVQPAVNLVASDPPNTSARTTGNVLPAVASAVVDQALPTASTMESQARMAACRRAVEQFTAIAQSDRPITSRPDIQLAHIARRRALTELRHEPQPDPGVYQNIAQGTPLAGWQQVADQEWALASGRKTLSAWTARARATTQPPQLDGQKNDRCWQSATAIELTSPFAAANKSSATQARFSYDNEYLYILIECPTDQVAQPPERTRQTRRYDMDLIGCDHVHLLLDTDRDYTSACELGINSQGHTFDRCCESAAWNPRWYVAVDATSKLWTAEMAVRLSNLTTAANVQGRAWAISAFRYIPGEDVHSWSQLRGYNPRHQGCGLLLFDPE